MSTEKYRIHVVGHLQDKLPRDGWHYTIMDDEYTSKPVDWQQAMDEAIRLGIGRKTSEADTYALDPGVEIKAVKTDG